MLPSRGHTPFQELGVQKQTKGPTAWPRGADILAGKDSLTGIRQHNICHGSGVHAVEKSKAEKENRCGEGWCFCLERGEVQPVALTAEQTWFPEWGQEAPARHFTGSHSLPTERSGQAERALSQTSSHSSGLWMYDTREIKKQLRFQT